MNAVVLTTPRSGAHLLFDLLDQAGIAAAWWPVSEATEQDGEMVVFVHGGQFHELRQLPEKRVHLIRTNTVAQAVSWYIASETGGWTVKPDQIPPYDEDAITEAVERITEDNRMLAAYATDTIVYEELTVTPLDIVEQVFGTRPKGRPRTRKLADETNDRYVRRWYAR